MLFLLSFLTYIDNNDVLIIVTKNKNIQPEDFENDKMPGRVLLHPKDYWTFNPTPQHTLCYYGRDWKHIDYDSRCICENFN